METSLVNVEASMVKVKYSNSLEILKNLNVLITEDYFVHRIKLIRLIYVIVM